MRQFILNNKPYSQTDRDDVAAYYISIGCIEVPILYQDNFFEPVWNGSNFIESLTPEEILSRKTGEAIAEETVKYRQRILDGQETCLLYTSPSPRDRG